MIVGPGNEGAGAGRRGHIRAADADREQVIDALKAAFTQGRLTKHELDQRVGLALESLTYADLDTLTSDIPRGLVAPSASASAPEAVSAPGGNVRRRNRAIAATAALAGVVFVVAFLINAGPVSGLLALGALASALTSLVLLIGQMRTARRDKSHGGRPPEILGRDAGHAAGLRPAAGARQLPRTEPRRQSTTDTARTPCRRPQVVVIA